MEALRAPPSARSAEKPFLYSAESRRKKRMKKNAKIKELKENKNMIKYIAYCRKSTDEKDKQVLSIEAQIAELKEFAKRDHLEITEFITEAKTAKMPGREQFALVLKKIEKGKAQGIVSWHPFYVNLLVYR